MLVLDTTSKSLQIILSGAVATTELPYVVAAVDINQSTFAVTASLEADGVTNGGVAVTVLLAPAASTSRKLNYMSVVNVDTAVVTLTVRVLNAGTPRTTFKAVLQVNDQLVFTDLHGWNIFDVDGKLKTSATGATGPTGPAGPAGTGTVTHTLSGLTANQLIIGNGVNDEQVLGTLGTTTTVLHGNAAGTPTFAAVDLTADVTGTLPVNKGGTGVATLAAHGVLIGAGTSALAVSGAGTAGQVLTSNGASADPTFQAATSGAVVQTTTVTGTQNDFALTTGATLLRVNNATAVTFTGFAAGTDGQKLTVVSVGAGQVNLTPQAAGTGSAAANRLINFATVGNTPLAAGNGVATYEYDATTARWRLTYHMQGALIAQPYSAGDFTSDVGTWTVDSGDIIFFAYKLEGRELKVAININTTSVTGTPNFLFAAVPGGFVATKNIYSSLFRLVDNNAPSVGSLQVVAGGAIKMGINSNGTFANATNTTYVLCTIDFEVN